MANKRQSSISVRRFPAQAYITLTVFSFALTVFFPTSPLLLLCSLFFLLHFPFLLLLFFIIFFLTRVSSFSSVSAENRCRAKNSATERWKRRNLVHRPPIPPPHPPPTPLQKKVEKEQNSNQKKSSIMKVQRKERKKTKQRWRKQHLTAALSIDFFVPIQPSISICHIYQMRQSLRQEFWLGQFSGAQNWLPLIGYC